MVCPPCEARGLAGLPEVVALAEAMATAALEAAWPAVPMAAEVAATQPESRKKLNELFGSQKSKCVREKVPSFGISYHF